MKLDEFMKFIRTQPVDDYIVRLQYKYAYEPKYNVSNEILYCDVNNSGINYIWLDDWNEGYDDITVLGFTQVEKALAYDPNQYEVGYKTGYHDGYTQGTLDARHAMIDALNKVINEISSLRSNDNGKTKENK